jgi:hypothetical protein
MPALRSTFPSGTPAVAGRAEQQRGDTSEFEDNRPVAWVELPRRGEEKAYEKPFG